MKLTDLEILEALKSAIVAFPPTHPEAKSLGVGEYQIELELRKARSVLQAHCLNMAETNWRELCRDLVDSLDERAWGITSPPSWTEVNNARAALAQSEPDEAASIRD